MYRPSRSTGAQVALPLVVLPRMAPARDGQRGSVARRLAAGAWLALSLALGVQSGHAPAMAALLAGLLASELLATPDDLGAPTLAAVFVPLAVLLVGWRDGLLVGAGTVIFGDSVLRYRNTRLLVWQSILLAAMITAGAWFAGVIGAPAAPPLAGRVLGGAWCLAYVAWAWHRRAAPGKLGTLAAAATMIGFTLAMLTAPAWLPVVPPSTAAWSHDVLRAAVFAAAFMFVDLAGASVAALRSGGVHGVAFWTEHLPVLFVRYIAGAIIAGAIVRWAGATGPSALGVAVALLVALQAALWLYRRVRDTLDSAVAALAAAVDARDPYTAGHSRRVADYAAMAAAHLGWSKGRVARTRTAGLLHDIGKIGVADHVLHKPGPLSSAEFALMQRHAGAGEAIVGEVRGLERVAAIVGQDHERWDGGGYPRGLAAATILPEARLIAIADVFDAMTSDRSYRRALREEDALSHLERVAGTQLDPVLTASFVDFARTPRPPGAAFCYCATH